jgi:hypothetical protein
MDPKDRLINALYYFRGLNRSILSGRRSRDRRIPTAPLPSAGDKATKINLSRIHEVAALQLRLAGAAVRAVALRVTPTQSLF